MKEKNRTRSSLRNILFSLMGYVFTILLQFVNRKVFVSLLTTEYLGLNGLFSNILSMLALSELGIGTAMTFALYKPVSDNNIEKIKSLMMLYKKVYSIIGWVVLGLGAGLTPFLQFLIKDMPDIPYIRVFYLLYVLNSGISYFYTYKRTLIICNQDAYISTTTTTVASVLTKILQIIFLYLTGNYFAYLIIQVVMTRIENIVISGIADKQYPYLLENNVQPLNEKEKAEIKDNVKAMFCHKIGNVVVNATDNIIISKVLGLSAAGLFSNYVLIFDNVTNLSNTVIRATSSSVGDLIAGGDKGKSYKVYKDMLFANFWIMCFCACSLMCLTQPFISLWLDTKYLLDMGFVIIMAACFYVSGMRMVTLVYKEAAGLFLPDRYKALVESAANLAISIPLTYYLGISGVKLGTLISTLMIPFWIAGYVLYKHYFTKKVFTYILIQIGYALAATVITGATYFLCCHIQLVGYVGFAIKAVTCCLVSNLLIVIMFYRSSGFHYFLGIVKNRVRK